MTVDPRLAPLFRLITAFRGPATVPGRIVLAVSGGGDSLSMLLLAARSRAAFEARRLSVHVATVDHGLRPESAAEARRVAAIAAELGFPHTILRWEGWNGSGNLQGEARAGRYSLLAEEAQALDAFAVVVAHTLDDQFETVLMARERGTPSSTGMRESRDLAPGVALLRPFLDRCRLELRAVLAEDGVAPIEDPSNCDRRFARIRMRDRLAGMTAIDRLRLQTTLAAAATQRAVADAAFLDALGDETDDSAAGADRTGALHRDRERFTYLAPSIRERLVARAVTSAGGGLGAPDPVAARRLSACLAEAASGFAATLGGCQVRVEGTRIVFRREYGREGLEASPLARRRQIFDRRFDVWLDRTLTDPHHRLIAFGALGRGNERERTLPVVVDRTNAVVAAHALVAAKAGVPEGPLPAASRVGWRFLADLRDADGRPPWDGSCALR